MSNYHLRDLNLSNKARGLLSTMLSLPDTWDYTTRGLAKICKDGVDGITAQLKELEQNGYLVRHRIRDGNGRIVDMEYMIYERPHTASPDTEKPDMVKPDMALPRLETPAQINKDKRSTEESITDPINTHSILSGGDRPSVLSALEAKRKETKHRDMDMYREIIKENIGYEYLLSDMPYDHDRLEEILELLVETVCTTKQYVRVAGADVPAEAVRSRLLKLDMEHIKFVFGCLKENTTKIRNIKQYLLTTSREGGKPHDFGAFLSLLAEQGFSVKRGKHLTFVHAGFRQNIRMRTLGEGYSEEEIRAVLSGQRAHQPKKRRAAWDRNRPQSVIDIQAKLAAGKGEGYRRWATVENLKRMAKTKLYMDEHGFSYEAMAERKAALTAKEKELSASISSAQNRLAEINVLKTHIVNYSKTRDVYAAYRKSGYSKKFLAEHEADIIIHQAAKKAFDELGVKKLPTVKSLQVEFAGRLKEKKEAYAELKKVRDELRDLAVHTANYEELRDLAQREERREKEHSRG